MRQHFHTLLNLTTFHTKEGSYAYCIQPATVIATIALKWKEFFLIMRFGIPVIPLPMAVYHLLKRYGVVDVFPQRYTKLFNRIKAKKIMCGM